MNGSSLKKIVAVNTRNTFFVYLIGLLIQNYMLLLCKEVEGEISGLLYQNWYYNDLYWTMKTQHLNLWQTWLGSENKIYTERRCVLVDWLVDYTLLSILSNQFCIFLENLYYQVPTLWKSLINIKQLRFRSLILKRHKSRP